MVLSEFDYKWGKELNDLREFLKTSSVWKCKNDTNLEHCYRDGISVFTAGTLVMISYSEARSTMEELSIDIIPIEKGFSTDDLSTTYCLKLKKAEEIFEMFEAVPEKESDMQLYLEQYSEITDRYDRAFRRNNVVGNTSYVSLFIFASASAIFGAICCANTDSFNPFGLVLIIAFISVLAMCCITILLNKHDKKLENKKFKEINLIFVAFLDDITEKRTVDLKEENV